jgi:hypothetical protein
MHNMTPVWEPEDPRKIYNELIKRCKDARDWCVACIVDESWVGFKGEPPFRYMIEDGIYYCRVIATTHREAMLKVVDNMPVIKILDNLDE